MSMMDVSDSSASSITSSNGSQSSWKGKKPLRPPSENFTNQAAQSSFKGRSWADDAVSSNGENDQEPDHELDNLDSDLKDLAGKGETNKQLIRSGMGLNNLAKQGQFDPMIRIFNEVYCEGGTLQPNEYIYNIMIKGCYRAQGCTKAERIDLAREWFAKMKADTRVSISIITCNIVLGGLMYASEIDEAIKFYEAIKKINIVPDDRMFEILINGSYRMGRMEKVKEFYKESKRLGINLPKNVARSVGKKPPNAQNVPVNAKNITHISWAGVVKGGPSIPAVSKPEPQEIEDAKIPGDVSTYQILITNYIKINQIVTAMRYFNAMPSAGIPHDVKIYNFVMDLLCKAGKVDEALKKFHSMPAAGITPDIDSHNILIQGLFDAERPHEVPNFLRAWQGKKVSVASSSTVSEEVLHVQRAVDKASTSALRPTLPVGSETSLKKLCSKLLVCISKGSAADIDTVYADFLAENSGVNPTASVYNLRLEGYIKYGEFTKAVAVVNEMIANQIYPHSKTYASYTLDCKTYTAIADALLKKNRVDEAFNCFDAMVRAGVPGDTMLYRTMIYGLDGVKQAHRAQPVFDVMENAKFQPSTKMFNVFISALLEAKEEQRAAEAFKLMARLEVNPNKDTPVILIRDIEGKGHTEISKEIRNPPPQPELPVQNQPEVIIDAKDYNISIKERMDLGDCDGAISIYNGMIEKKIKPSAVTCNVLVTGLFRLRPDDAPHYFAKFRKEKLVEELTYKLMFSGYFRAQKIKNALGLIPMLGEDGITLTPKIHGLIIQTYVLNIDTEKAKEYYKQNIGESFDSRDNVDISGEVSHGASFIKILLFLEKKDRDMRVFIKSSADGFIYTQQMNFVKIRLKKVFGPNCIEETKENSGGFYVNVPV